MTAAEAIRAVRRNKAYAELVRDAYLGEDLLEEAARFAESAEFASVLCLLDERVRGARILDLGAGRGIASYAFAHAGAAAVYALEPDPSVEAGRGAFGLLSAHVPAEFHLLDAYGESIPLPDESIDVVYGRQVLHHVRSLDDAVRECARVLRRGGVFLACREHVVTSRSDLEKFLRNHPLHRFTKNEHAYKVNDYCRAVLGADLRLERVLGPWDDVTNAFPAVRDERSLDDYASDALVRRFGRLGTLLSRVPGVVPATWLYIRRPKPGALYSFLAIKP